MVYMKQFFYGIFLIFIFQVNLYAEHYKNDLIPILICTDDVLFPDKELNIRIPLSKKSLEIYTKNQHKVFVTKVAANDQQSYEKVGTIGEIKNISRLRDNLYRLRIIGTKIAEIVSVQENQEIHYVKIRPQVEEIDHQEKINAARHLLKKTYREYKNTLFAPISLEEEAWIYKTGDAGKLSYFLSSILYITAGEKQLILETHNRAKRLEKIIYLIKNKLQLIKAVLTGEDQTQGNFSQQEPQLQNLYTKIQNAHLPSDILEKVMREFNNLKNIGLNSVDSAWKVEYIETITALPWKQEKIPSIVPFISFLANLDTSEGNFASNKLKPVKNNIIPINTSR